MAIVHCFTARNGQPVLKFTASSGQKILSFRASSGQKVLSFTGWLTQVCTLHNSVRPEYSRPSVASVQRTRATYPCEFLELGGWSRTVNVGQLRVETEPSSGALGPVAGGNRLHPSRRSLSASYHPLNHLRWGGYYTILSTLTQHFSEPLPHEWPRVAKSR